MNSGGGPRGNALPEGLRFDRQKCNFSTRPLKYPPGVAEIPPGEFNTVTNRWFKTIRWFKSLVLIIWLKLLTASESNSWTVKSTEIVA